MSDSVPTPHSNRVRPRVRVAALCAALCALLPASPSIAEAQPKNRYGAQGRTVLSGGLGGFKSNIETPDAVGHDATWSTWAHLTAVHFWLENLAVGGTLLGGTSHLKGNIYSGSSSRTWFGGDLDIIGHLPLNPRLSLRLWVWGGLRWSERKLARPTPGSDVPNDGFDLNLPAASPETVRTMGLTAGISPGMLVHLSQSVALTFGPGITFYKGLRGNTDFDYSLHAGPGMTYSFGPDEGSATTFEDARSFGKKGRSVMLMYGVFNENDFYSGLGFSRFIVDRIALGGYASGGLQGDYSNRSFLSGGLQALIDLPVSGSLSVLLAPRVGYRWTEASARYPDPIARYDSPLPPVTLHELQLAAPIFLALHLHDGLVLGIGPEVASDRRLATRSSGATPDKTYVQVGLASTIVASF